jgi:hypothetical protein
MIVLERKKYDYMWIGLVLGFISPLLTLYAFYLFRYSSHLTFEQFYTQILLAANIVTPSISLCVISNLLVFFIFIWTDRYYSARGVLFATIIYGGYVVYQKYIK